MTTTEDRIWQVCSTCGERYLFKKLHEESGDHLSAKALLERLPGVSIVRDDLDQPHVVIEDDDGEVG